MAYQIYLLKSDLTANAFNVMITELQHGGVQLDDTKLQLTFKQVTWPLTSLSDDFTEGQENKDFVSQPATGQGSRLLLIGQNPMKPAERLLLYSEDMNTNWKCLLASAEIDQILNKIHDESLVMKHATMFDGYYGSYGPEEQLYLASLSMGNVPIGVLLVILATTKDQAVQFRESFFPTRTSTYRELQLMDEGLNDKIISADSNDSRKVFLTQLLCTVAVKLK
jgi:hypothetical protein